jgi:hypothetical protein
VAAKTAAAADACIRAINQGWLLRLAADDSLLDRHANELRYHCFMQEQQANKEICLGYAAAAASVEVLQQAREYRKQLDRLQQQWERQVLQQQDQEQHLQLDGGSPQEDFSGSLTASNDTDVICRVVVGGVAVKRAASKGGGCSSGGRSSTSSSSGITGSMGSAAVLPHTGRGSWCTQTAAWCKKGAAWVASRFSKTDTVAGSSGCNMNSSNSSVGARAMVMAGPAATLAAGAAKAARGAASGTAASRGFGASSGRAKARRMGLMKLMSCSSSLFPVAGLCC